MAKTSFNIYVISDLHIGHDNISKYCSRPFSTTEEMNQKLISNCNNVVRSNDILIFLGDLLWTGGNSELIKAILKSFNGRKILVKGNHDRKSNAFYLANGIDFICNKFEWEIANKKILFIHDPYLVKNNELKMYDIVLHGHCHNNKPLFRKHNGKIFINVSVENTRYQPMNLISLINKCISLDIKNETYSEIFDSIIYKISKFFNLTK